jgi:3-oxoacyl-[acyl-carrier protein] reductase
MSDSSRRSVLVTGGSRGLGAAFVGSFLGAGDRVATCSRSTTPAIDRWRARSELSERFYFETLDITEPKVVESFLDRVVDRFGGIDVLVNNAGAARSVVLGLMSDADIDAVIDLNLKATIRVTRAVVRRMLIQGSGRIINISSIVGLAGYRGLSVYGATKAGLDALTRALARELGSRGITVNSVAPGYLETELSQGLTQQQLDRIARRTPLGRLAEPNEVTAAVSFLASPDAAFITGQVLVVDGGLTA